MKFWRVLLSAILCFLLVTPCSAIETEDSFQWEISKETVLAGLWEADITSIQSAYELGWITCTELTEYYLERIEEYNDTYNCFITLCDDVLTHAAQRDEAMAQGEAEGKLFGIPVVVKDNIDYAGWHTTNGFSKNSNQIADTNAQIVDYLLSEGAVIIGKTNMSTQAMDARASYSQAVGETKNAYNSELATGGSSGGSAAATSLNFAVAGLGTDTNSSLRLPAALNGCVSLRSTFGLFSTEGIVRLNSHRDVPGAITRSVMDQAIMLDVISGGATNYAENLNAEVLQGLRIGVLKEMTYAVGGVRNEYNLDDEVTAAFETAVSELSECGAEVVLVSIPGILDLASDAFYSDNTSVREKMYIAVENAMAENEVSALIFPTYVTTPLRSGTDSNGRYWDTDNQTFINNTSKLSSCANLPELALPIGNHSLGAAIGMEIAALRNEEQLLLDIAYAYTTRYDHRQAPENAGDLYAEYYEGSLAELLKAYYTAKAEYEAALLATEVPTEEQKPVAVIPDSVTELAADNENSITALESAVLILMAALVAALIVCIVVLVALKNKNRKKRHAKV